MAKRIDLPQTPRGDAEEQLRTLYSYLYQMAETLNNNLAEIGGAELTDDERRQLTEIIGDGTLPEGQLNEAETLKSLIVKTANFVQSTLTEYRMNLLGEYVADGKFGKYVRRTGLDVDVTPTGIQQNFTFQEIIQGLKTYEINAKNYIKTGLLRTVSSIPVYGVAIGKDVVTFAEDGTETYNDGNKVAELTADELSFWQGGNKIASYTGSKISFLYSGSEVMYIQNGKTYVSSDFEIITGKKLIIKSGAQLIIESGNLQLDENGNLTINGGGTFTGTLSANCINGGTLKVGGTSNGSIGVYDENNTLIGWISKYGFGMTDGSFNVKTSNLLIDSGYHHLTTIETSLNRKVYTTIGRDAYAEDIEAGEAMGSISSLVSAVYIRNIDKISENGKDINTYLRLGTEEDNGTRYGILDAKAYIRDSGNLNAYSPLDMIFKTKKIDVYWANITNDLTVRDVYYRNLIQNSSKDVKHDIQDMEPVGEKLDRLRPVTFVYDDDPEEKRRAGLIYEETAEVLPEICTGDESAKAISYVEMIPMLLKEIQELRARVKALEEREGGN